MRRSLTTSRLRAHLWRALAEIAFIIFLFYANLLMGEFTAANGRGKTFAAALSDIFTRKTVLIAFLSALAGYPFFEFLRKKTEVDH